MAAGRNHSSPGQRRRFCSQHHQERTPSSIRNWPRVGRVSKEKTGRLEAGTSLPGAVEPNNSNPDHRAIGRETGVAGPPERYQSGETVPDGSPAGARAGGTTRNPTERAEHSLDSSPERERRYPGRGNLAKTRNHFRSDR